VLLFPHLIAGPILRPAELLPQLHRPKRRLGVAVFGIAIFSIGLLKKLVFADSLAEPVEALLRPGAGEGLGKADYLLAIYGFAAQIYRDFSGNRLGYRGQTLNLFTTMALGGLWHGASRNFVLWGVAHGAGISFVHAVRRFRPLYWMAALPRRLNVLATFHFVLACWILFRAPDLATARSSSATPSCTP